MKYLLQAFASDQSGVIVCEFVLTPKQMASIRRKVPIDADDPEGKSIYALNSRLEFYLGVIE